MTKMKVHPEVIKFFKNHATQVITNENTEYFFLPAWISTIDFESIELHSLGSLPKELIEIVSDLRDSKNYPEKIPFQIYPALSHEDESKLNSYVLNSKLSLTRPLAFFDVEATGLNVSVDRIVSIAILRIQPNGVIQEFAQKINPGFMMSEEVIKVHGITNEMLADKPKFETIAPGLHEFLSGADLAGFNSNNFDIPILVEEFLRLNIYFPEIGTRFIDVGNIMKKKEERTLSAAIQFYCGKSMENAHDASADTLATLAVFNAQIERYGLPNNVEELAKFSAFDNRVDFAGKIIRDEAGDMRFNFGPHRGEKVTTDPGFLEWMLMKDFTRNTKQVVRSILDSMYKPSPLDGPPDDPDFEEENELIK